MLNKFKNTQAYIKNYSEQLVKLLKIEIGRNRNRKYKSGSYSNPIDNTGKLRQSIEAIQKINKDSFSSSIMMNDYGMAIDGGTDHKKQPPVENIIQWIKSKPIRLRDRKGRFVQAKEYRIRGLAYIIGKKIKMEGIQPTSFIDEAIDQSIEKLNKLGAAVGEDVMLNLDDILVKAGYIKKGEEYVIQSDK